MIPEEKMPSEWGFSLVNFDGSGETVPPLNGVPQGDVEDDQEPLTYKQYSNFLVLMHDAKCKSLAGLPGPHLRCFDACDFTQTCYANFSNHLPTCSGLSCRHPFCKESRDLHDHFMFCQEVECGACRGPIELILEKFKQDLCEKGHGYLIPQIYEMTTKEWRDMIKRLAA